VAILTKEEQEQNLARSGVRMAQKVDMTLDEITEFGNPESMMKIVQSVANYKQMVSQQITLINDSLSAAIPFTRENLYLFCALSGNGKSTVAANISWPLWKQKKKILVISNEEPEQDVLFRIAALELEADFNEYKKGRMAPEQISKCVHLCRDIAQYVKVLDVSWREGGSTKIEWVQAALDKIIGQGFSAVLIDYYQLIKDSVNDKTRSRYDVLNDFRIWLGRYIKKCEIPVCMFVQLYSLGKKGGVKDIDARIKECSAVVEPATVIIEIVPNVEDKTSDFLIHKDRFGNQGWKITCPYHKGRFLEELSEQELATRKATMARAKAEKDLESFMDKANDDEQFSGADYISGQKI
jgi:hypothetical protein